MKRVVDSKRLWKDDRQPKITKSLADPKSFSQISSLLFPPQKPQKQQKLVSGFLELNDIQNLSESSGSFVAGILGAQGVGKTTILEHLTRQQKQSQSTTGIDLANVDGILFLDSKPMLTEQHDIEIASLLFSICHLIIIVIEYRNEHEILTFLKQVVGGLSQDWKPQVVFVITKCPAFVFGSKYGNSIGDLISKYLDPEFFSPSTLAPQQYWNPEGMDDLSSEDEELETERVLHGPWNVYAIPNSKLFQRLPTKEEMEESWSLSVRYEVAIDDFCSRVKGISRLATPESPFAISEKDWYQKVLRVWNSIREKG